jgi:hypothetical protein
LKKALARKDEPTFEAIAFKGVGVFETLRECGRLVLAELKKAQTDLLAAFPQANTPPGDGAK